MVDPDALLPVLFIAGFAVLAIGLIAYSIITTRKRTQEMEQAANGLGMTFLGKSFDPKSHAIGRFDLFDRGRSRKAYNAMEARLGDVDVLIFDYRYTIGSGKNSTTYSQTVVALGCQQHRLPRFAVKPEHFGHRIASVFGFDDIDFKGDPEFSKRYHVSGEDRAAIIETFHSGVRRHLTQMENAGCVEGDGDWLLWYRSGKRRRPDEIQDLMNEALDTSSHLSVR